MKKFIGYFSDIMHMYAELFFIFLFVYYINVHNECSLELKVVRLGAFCFYIFVWLCRYGVKTLFKYYDIIGFFRGMEVIFVLVLWLSLPDVGWIYVCQLSLMHGMIHSLWWCVTDHIFVMLSRKYGGNIPIILEFMILIALSFVFTI